MEKKVENEMESGVSLGVLQGFQRASNYQQGFGVYSSCPVLAFYKQSWTRTLVVFRLLH